MPIPPQHILYGTSAQSGYEVAKQILIDRVRETHVPLVAHGRDRVLRAYMECKRRMAKLFLSQDLLLDEDPAPFLLDFRGQVHLGPDDLQRISIEVPPTVVTETLLAMEQLDRTAIANVLVGRKHAECATALECDDALAIPDDIRPDIEREVALLAELYEHVIAGTMWRDDTAST